MSKGQDHQKPGQPTSYAKVSKREMFSQGKMCVLVKLTMNAVSSHCVCALGIMLQYVSSACSVFSATNLTAARSVCDD